MRLFWSALAEADREGIFRYIFERNPIAAIGVDTRIETVCQQLIRFPELGKVGRVTSTREMVIGGTPYVVVYQLGPDRILILRILHGAQRWPPVT